MLDVRVKAQSARDTEFPVGELAELHDKEASSKNSGGAKHPLHRCAAQWTRCMRQVRSRSRGSSRAVPDSKHFCIAFIA